MLIYLVVTTLLVFLIWASFPSFILVLQYRKETKAKDNGLSLTGRSYCNNCHIQLKWYNLIPVFSYIIQRWKCRNCWFKIPSKYFYYELLWWILLVIVFLISIHLKYNLLNILQY